MTPATPKPPMRNLEKENKKRELHLNLIIDVVFGSEFQKEFFQKHILNVNNCFKTQMEREHKKNKFALTISK